MNDLANITVFTLKKGYAQNVCDVSKFDTFAYFYAISNVYFLLNVSVTHHPRITNTFILVTPLHFFFTNLANLMGCPHQRGRRGGLMVNVLDSGASAPGLSPGRGHCVVFLGKTLYSHGASLHPGV